MNAGPHSEERHLFDRFRTCPHPVDAFTQDVFVAVFMVFFVGLLRTGDGRPLETKMEK
ncbi:hypothetical protein CcI6DRAFT_00613 [Frankia sp. CcI6]|nr:hypothetical protein CcI6DRAFT_00613 [Frankia sp. CcI6]KDA41078.1 hypothetical protein BMG523Draft_04086 [Frankia sp. BMG5.23]KEZ37117.1 hypothetical protein CEDDRAFT_01368 [Frankia sp. CeD]KFB04357.1 hypothetical protein ALLO2DRAFT_02807 [Frankia sp. Allo2]OAA20704.1 hypothetical protein AAY23_108819 [Frankia casuarinae]